MLRTLKMLRKHLKLSYSKSTYLNMLNQIIFLLIKIFYYLIIILSKILVNIAIYILKSNLIFHYFIFFITIMNNIEF